MMELLTVKTLSDDKSILYRASTVENEDFAISCQHVSDLWRHFNTSSDVVVTLVDIHNFKHVTIIYQVFKSRIFQRDDIKKGILSLRPEIFNRQ